MNEEDRWTTHRLRWAMVVLSGLLTSLAAIPSAAQFAVPEAGIDAERLGLASVIEVIALGSDVVAAVGRDQDDVVQLLMMDTSSSAPQVLTILDEADGPIRSDRRIRLLRYRPGPGEGRWGLVLIYAWDDSVRGSETSATLAEVFVVEGTQVVAKTARPLRLGHASYRPPDPGSRWLALATGRFPGEQAEGAGSVSVGRLILRTRADGGHDLGIWRRVCVSRTVGQQAVDESAGYCGAEFELDEEIFEVVRFDVTGRRLDTARSSKAPPPNWWADAPGSSDLMLEYVP